MQIRSTAGTECDCESCGSRVSPRPALPDELVSRLRSATSGAIYLTELIENVDISICPSITAQSVLKQKALHTAGTSLMFRKCESD